MILNNVVIGDDYIKKNLFNPNQLSKKIIFFIFMTDTINAELYSSFLPNNSSIFFILMYKILIVIVESFDALNDFIGKY